MKIFSLEELASDASVPARRASSESKVKSGRLGVLTPEVFVVTRAVRDLLQAYLKAKKGGWGETESDSEAPAGLVGVRAACEKGHYITKHTSRWRRRKHLRFFWLDFEARALRWNSPKKDAARTTIAFADMARVVPRVEGGRQDSLAAIDEPARLLLEADSDDTDVDTEPQHTRACELFIWAKPRNLRLTLKSADELCCLVVGLCIGVLQLSERELLGTTKWCSLEAALRRWNRSQAHALVALGVPVSRALGAEGGARATARAYCQLAVHPAVHELWLAASSQGLCSVGEAAAALRRQGCLGDVSSFLDYLAKCDSLVMGVAPAVGPPRRPSLVDDEVEKGARERGLTHAYLTVITWNQLLSSEWNSLLVPAKRPLADAAVEAGAVVSTPDAFPDLLTEPYSAYFIRASHNTYLTGGQVCGTSCEGQILRVLCAGVRCVELDLWDGPTGPRVAHALGGVPLSGRLDLEPVLFLLRDLAFLATDAPLILTLECRLVRQRSRAAELLQSVLGRLLGVPGRCPADARGKILLKLKLIKNGVPTLEDLIDGLDLAKDDELSRLATIAGYRQREMGATTAKGGAPTGVPSKNSAEKGTKSRTPPPADMLHMASTSEACLLRSKTVGAWTPGHLLRVFPSGRRLNSSNFDPMEVWLRGGELAALNQQAADAACLHDHGLFNGSCGYVRKPATLQHPSYGLALDAAAAAAIEQPLRLTVTVIGAMNVPAPDARTCPLVEVSVHGAALDRATRQTAPVVNETRAPVWRTALTFTVRAPSLALLCFQVRAARGPVLARNAARLSLVREGFRWLPLRDPHFRPCAYSGLFVRVQKEIVQVGNDGG